MQRLSILGAAAFALFPGCLPPASTVLQWEYTGGPAAQNIAAVLGDDRSPGTLYVGLTSGEIYGSPNGGTTWQRLSAVTHRRCVYRLVQDPEFPDKVYAATEAGAFVSTDRCRTWSSLAIAGTGVRTILIDPWSPLTLYAGTQGKGIWKSTDGGATWGNANASSDARLGSAEVYDILVDVDRPSLLYAAATALGIIRSTDGGTTWQTLTEEFSATGSRTTHLLMRRGGVTMLMYGTNAGSIVKSVNGGDSWIPSRNGLESDRITSLFAHPQNEDLVFAGTERGMIVSSDFGTSWSAAGGDLPKVAATLVPGGRGVPFTIYAFGNGIGLKSSTDNGATWRAADASLGGSTVRLMTTDPPGIRIAAAVGTVCLVSLTGAAGRWQPAGPGITGGAVKWVSSDPQLPGVMYATTPSGVFQSTDNGASWNPAVKGLRISPILFEAHPSIKTRLYVTSEQGLFVSTDRGNTWTQPRPLNARWQITGLTFSPTNAGLILAGTSNSGVIVTRDGGFSWELARYGLPATEIRAVTLDDKDQDTYYAFTAEGECYRTFNKGLEWNRYGVPWSRGDSVRVAFDRFLPSSVISLVNNRELYYSPSGGSTWFPMLKQLIAAEVIALHWNAASSTAYAGTLDKGVFRAVIGSKLLDILGE
ncbi:MAG: hypothetical protein AB1428_03285 [Bacteroidota bacterium]